MRFFVGQVGFCCNLDTARADGVFCELITWGRNVQQSCGSPKAALVWDVARWKCIKVWGTPFVTLGLPLSEPMPEEMAYQICDGMSCHSKMSDFEGQNVWLIECQKMPEYMSVRLEH